jgi:hypothetical protein
MDGLSGLRGDGDAAGPAMGVLPRTVCRHPELPVFGTLIRLHRTPPAGTQELLPQENVLFRIDSNLNARFSVAKVKRGRPKGASRHHQHTANRLFDDALSLASTLADSRKRAGADRIVELASATREFGASLDDFPQLRHYSDQAADSLDDLADYIVRTDIPDMLDDFAGFAKRKPVATLTLGVAAGLAFTQLVHGWPVPVKARRAAASNGRVKRRAGRRTAVN